LLRALNSRLDSTNVRSYGQRQPDLRLRLEKVDQRMGFWTNKNHRTGFDDAEDLAYPPSGGPVKMCLLGIGVALIPFIYGAHCLLSGRALLFGQNGNMKVTGAAATALAIAYMAVGVFHPCPLVLGIAAQTRSRELFAQIRRCVGVHRQLWLRDV
jgi:hypothetical protein